MKIIISILVILFTTGMYAHASNEPAFVVYFSKGKCVGYTSNKTRTLKKGDAIFLSDKITVNKGGEITLLCAKHSLVKLTAGSYEAKDLQSRCGTEKTSFTATYFKYIWAQMTHHHEVVADNPEKFMKTAGAVSRGESKVQFNVAIDTVFYCYGPMKIKLGNQQETFLLKIFEDESSDHTVKTLKISGSLPLDTVADIAGTGTYYWQLCGMDNRNCSRRAYIRIMPKVLYNKAIQTLLDKVVQTTPAETAFMSGFIMEENHFLAEAYKYYRLALNTEPENEIYQKTINRFYE